MFGYRGAAATYAGRLSDCTRDRNHAALPLAPRCSEGSRVISLTVR